MSSKSANYWIDYLNLLPHPEGGYYSESYRSKTLIPTIDLDNFFEGAERNLATAIYFLLQADQFSAFHTIKSDETWHHYAGGSIDLYEIGRDGLLDITRIGKNIEIGERLQYTVKAGKHFAARPSFQDNFSLLGCTVYPGFDFRDFRLSTAAELIELSPDNEGIIKKLSIR
jgi:predicted cupin superfamily sugar epimerase